MRRLLTIGALALALVACSGSDLEAVTPVAAPLGTQETGWVELTPQAIEIDGNLVEPTCSNAPGSDSAFRFWARRGASDRLVVFFDGGGACWDDVTCAIPRLVANTRQEDGLYKAELLPSDNPNTMNGIFALDDARNPLRDWSFVFVPYCTGDVHSGSNTAHYVNPDDGKDYAIEHRGADNFRLILEWMRMNFDAPEAIVVTGSSAGAYGAATHYAAIRDAFPSGRALMLGDAGQGVTPPEFLEQRNANWNFQLPANVFGEDGAVTADEDVIGLLAHAYPADRFAQYTTAHDITQSSFYALMGVNNACRAWTTKMVRDLGQRQRTISNFRSYLADGQTHTILRSPLFYTEQSGGASFAAWFTALLADAPPESVACERCVAQRVRCPF
jgi:hypothetical protein